LGEPILTNAANETAATIGEFAGFVQVYCAGFLPVVNLV
jgi:hypothetical protein